MFYRPCGGPPSPGRCGAVRGACGGLAGACAPAAARAFGGWRVTPVLANEMASPFGAERN